MQAIHELGHAIGAWITHGHVARIVLNPLTISRTDVAENPRPLVVAWAGPVFGAIMPVLVWLIAATVRLPGTYLLRFFAGFCLLANGAYIGLGSFTHAGDCGTLLQHGTQPWQL